MEIKPQKKIRGVRYSSIASDDFLQRPSIKAVQDKIPHNTNIGYANRKLMYEGKDMGLHIRETAQENPQLLAQIANELEKFRENCFKRRKRRSFWSRKIKGDFSDEDLGVIFSLCDAYILRISELIKQRFDQTKDGLSVLFDENGQLILNGMNIHAFIENCKNNKNEKALIFLKGIRSRLQLVLENKSNNRNFDRIQDVIGSLFEEIDTILNQNKD